MIRALQIDYNIVMNQNRQYLEKTIGTFFMMDWHLLPSQFKNEKGETTAELIEDWRETVRELGIGLMDGSPRNTQNQNPNQNNIQQYDISYINNIQMNMQMARDFEDKAFAMIGITRERSGNPNEYMTGEGIKQGVEASYAQTEVIYKRFNTAKVKEKEIELAIAQYATTNKKDISVNYVNGQNERIIQNFVDPNFAFRKLETFAADDSSKRRELEMFKNHILQMNTMDNDIYDLGKVVTSNNFVSLLEFGLKKKQKLEQQTAETRAHEKEVEQMRIDAQQAQIDKSNQREDLNKQLDRESQEEIARIKARATLADSNTNPEMLDKLLEAEDREEKRRDNQVKNDIKQQEVDLKKNKQENDLSSTVSGLDLEFLKLREAAKDRVARREQSKDSVAIAKINI